MNFNDLKETQSAVASKTGFTLNDLLGKKTILPLPAGLHECILTDITSTATSRALRLTVKDTADDTEYSVTINIGNNAEQADIFLSIISHLLAQLDLEEFDLAKMKDKIGNTIMILGIEKVSDRGTFINYTFNPTSMLSHL